MSYSISSSELQSENEEDKVKEEDNELNQMESTSSGGREDDLFGRAEDFSDRRLNNENDGPVPKYSSQSIYECAQDWVSQGNMHTSGIVKYYEAYYAKSN